jgi:hypothetical protein
LDSCSVRAKRAGDLTGPNPTDRGKRGTKYHIATTGDGVPVACAATAANAITTSSRVVMLICLMPASAGEHRWGAN